MLLASLALLAAGCSTEPEPSMDAEQPRQRSGARAGQGGESAPARPRLGAGRDIARAVTTLLERRAVAVRTADAETFAGGVAGNATFRAQQQQWFENLTQLPVGGFGYTLDPASLVRERGAYWGTVDVSLRLEEYDDRPVVTRDRYRFERTDGRFVVTSVTDRAWERDHPGAPQPWDLEPIRVRESRGVLGVFDTGSVVGADQVMTAVARGITAMAPRIPLSWDQRVVVYALADPAFLSSLPGVPGGDAQAIDGLTFPVMATPDLMRVASTRFVLSPRLLATDPASRDRLIHHELVHVALGSRDDRIPVWLSEGLAEYLSVQTLPSSERVIAGEALDAARRGVSALPDGELFNGPDSHANYGVSWWVCEEIVDTYGEAMLWTLVEELAGVDDPNAELEAILGTSERALVRDAARLMLATYEPEPERPRRGRSS